MIGYYVLAAAVIMALLGLIVWYETAGKHRGGSVGIVYNVVLASAAEYSTTDAARFEIHTPSRTIYVRMAKYDARITNGTRIEFWLTPPVGEIDIPDKCIEDGNPAVYVATVSYYRLKRYFIKAS